MRLPVALLVGPLLGLLLSFGGCGPPIPPEELGTVLDEVPEIATPESPADGDSAGSPESSPNGPAEAVDDPQSHQ